MPTSPTEAEPEYDLAVIGAGPAGLAGAVTAEELGLSVCLLDSSPQPGGQFYRHPAPALRAARPEALHHDWPAFAALRDRLAAGTVRVRAAHHVWTVERLAGPDGEGRWRLHALAGADGGRPVRIRARALLLATGAAERQLPFPGWTLPGVVSAGGAQAMLKSGLVLPGRRVVVAGSGPLLLAVAATLVEAGAHVPLLVEASGYLDYARHPGVLAAAPGKLLEGAAHAAALLAHRVRPLTRHAITRVHGTSEGSGAEVRVNAVTVSALDRDWRPLPGSERRVACDAVAVGHGLVPHLDLATGLGCAVRTTPDGASALVLDAGQQTSVPGVWSAGETGGVGGARLARIEGELAALAIVSRLRGRPRATAARARRLARARRRLRAFAEAMAAVHAPGPGWSHWLEDTTEVCRCEEVTAGCVRAAVDGLGARDTRSVKLLTRAGMGWCQGRVCGGAVARLTGSPPGPDRRPLATPVTLAALAATPPDRPAPDPTAEPASDARTGPTAPTTDQPSADTGPTRSDTHRGDLP
ncbi:NAD(P)/FAD-dependent oxidoreductase [Streptomyces durbertensis]|uniref:NAD(P)/FAD-dependent oxidoreductase n=1 Tax=Streptomyces durbertensis TaxID=2448886 RepID=UPI002B1EB00E|nr:NAD(P)/FAD-dependent oxidoreductase [Streptomyces durbertensis]